MASKKKNGHEVAEQREREFLMAYFSVKSETRFDRTASAITAGYTPRMALWNANRLIAKFESRSVKDCVEAVGINAPSLAVMLRENLDAAEGKDQLSGLRLAMGNRGEQTDSTTIQKNLAVNIPVMIIQGMTNERLIALRRGSDPARELSPRPEQDAIDVEATEMSVETLESELRAEGARTLKPDAFTGRSLNEP